MNAKRFLFVAVAILLLAIADNLTVSRVGAQAGGPELVVSGDVEGTCLIGIDNLGRVFRRYRGGDGLPWQQVAQLPAGTPVHMSLSSGQYPVHDGFVVGMREGDLWRMHWMNTGCPNSSSDVQFEYLGNIFGGTVPTQGTTWGKVKQGYQK